MIEPEPAPFAADMWRQEPGLTPKRHQFAPQLRARAVRGLPRIVLIGNDLFAHQALGALFQLDKIVGQRKIHRQLREMIVGER